MSLPVYVIILLCCGCVSVGYLAAILCRRPTRIAPADPSSLVLKAPQHEQASVEAKQCQELLQSLRDVTTKVTSQVDQHNLRLNEASLMLESPEPSAGTVVLAATSLLITANQQLQTELASAKNEIERQREQMDSVMAESRTDALTKLANRRAVDLELERQFDLYRRKQSTVSLLMIDIDHFKRFNDNHGHMIGDMVLQGVARNLAATLRDIDFVGRFGGEEFAALLPLAQLDEAVRAAERIRRAIAETPHNFGEAALQVTLSVGIAEIRSDESPADLVRRADEALYAAKRGGRNKCFYHDGMACNPSTALTP
jgi:diguanylate cyclase